MGQNSEVTFSHVANWKPILENTIDAGNEAIGFQLVAEAKPLSPVDEGQMRNSIQFKTSSGASGGFNDESSEEKALTELEKPEAGAMLFGATAEHSIYPEFGTRYMAPQPSIRPAVQIVLGGKPPLEVLDKIQKEMDRGVLKAGQRRETFR